jgi:hypothetical protein
MWSLVWQTKRKEEEEEKKNRAKKTTESHNDNVNHTASLASFNACNNFKV